MLEDVFGLKCGPLDPSVRPFIIYGCRFKRHLSVERWVPAKHAVNSNVLPVDIDKVSDVRDSKALAPENPLIRFGLMFVACLPRVIQEGAI